MATELAFKSGVLIAIFHVLRWMRLQQQINAAQMRINADTERRLP